MTIIYHLADKTCWTEQEKEGAYKGRLEDLGDGFLHFSDKDQIVTSARLHKAGQEGLVIMAVDADQLGDSLKWEVSRNDMLFPHVYGDVPVTAIKSVKDLPIDADGLHVFPEFDDA